MAGRKTTESGRLEDQETRTEYLILFGWSFLAATILPIGSEFAFVAIVRRESTGVLPLLVAGTGNSLGALTTYWLGRRAARILGEERPGTSPRLQRAAEALRRHGEPLLILSWLPVLGDALVAAAGAAGLRPMPVVAWIVTGKFARYAVLAWTALRV